MLERKSLEDRLNTLMEAPLAPQLVSKIDSIINKLEQLREYDYDYLGLGYGGRKYMLNNWHNLSGALDEILRASNEIRQFGRSQEEIQEIAQRQREQQALNQVRAKHRSKLQSIVLQFSEQFPRHIAALKDGIKFIQPSGEEYEIDWSSLTTEGFIKLILAFRKLYRSGAYKVAEERVQQIRDFGFNISSKLVSTQYSSFRTRFCVISDVFLSYRGPFVEEVSRNDFEVVNDYIPGSCSIKAADTSILKAYEIQNTTLNHIGEIIDTFDTVFLACSGDKDGSNNLATIDSIQCMGQNVVQYVLNAGLPQDRTKNRFDIEISSDEIDNPVKLKHDIYERIRSKRKEQIYRSQTVDQDFDFSK